MDGGLTRDQSERINTIAGNWPRWAYSQELIATLIEYLAGRSTLADMKAAWDAWVNGDHYVNSLTFGNLSAQQRGELDIIDERLLALAADLLSHRRQWQRDLAKYWLSSQGIWCIAPVTPLLNHPRAETRLAAVQTLQRVGGPQIEALLLARLAVEPSQRVREAMLATVQAPQAEKAPADTASPIQTLIATAQATMSALPRPLLSWYPPKNLPPLHWTTGEEAPAEVLGYLLFCQSGMPSVHQGQVAPQVRQALALLDRASAGDVALALFRGWVEAGGNGRQTWFLPLVCALGDDRLVSRFSKQIHTWLHQAWQRADLLVRLLRLIDAPAARAELTRISRADGPDHLVRAAQHALTLPTP